MVGKYSVIAHISCSPFSKSSCLCLRPQCSEDEKASSLSWVSAYRYSFGSCPIKAKLVLGKLKVFSAGKARLSFDN